MNRRPSGLSLSESFQGLLNYKTAEGLSPNTLRSYHDQLQLWLEYQGDVGVAAVTGAQLLSRTFSKAALDRGKHRATIDPDDDGNGRSSPVSKVRKPREKTSENVRDYS